MAKVTLIEEYGEEETYDIWNKEEDSYLGQGNFVIDGLIVHNSILANGVKNFKDLLIMNAMGHPGPMQCVRSDSNINIEGGFKQISSLDSNSDKILAYDTHGDTFYTDKYEVRESGIKEIYRIRLEDGSIINVSGDHKIYTEAGYVAASDLKIGQDVVVYREGD